MARKIKNFFLIQKVIRVTVSNTKDSCLYDLNSTGEFTRLYTALCYGIVDWEERGQGKPELAVMSLQPFQGSFSTSVEGKAVLHKGAFHIAAPTVTYSLVKILKKPHFKDT